MSHQEKNKNKQSASNSSLKSILAFSWQSAGYGIGVFGRQLVVYLTLPFFTNYMPQNEFGIVSLAVAVMAFVNTLTNAGMPAATYRFYHDKDDTNSKQRVLGSSLWMFVFFAAVPAIFCLLFADPIAHTFLGSNDFATVIRLASALLMVDTLVNYGYILLRIQIRPLATSLSNLLIAIAQMGIALILVFYYKAGAVGYLGGLLAGETIGLVFLAFLSRHIISVKISRKTMGTMLRYGLPLLPVALSMWVLHLADRSLIGLFAGLNQVAIYEVGHKIGMLVALATAPFQAAWPAFAFAAMRKPNAQMIYRDVSTYLLFFSLLFALGLFAFKSEILRLLAPANYVPALSIVGWVALAQVFNSAYMVLSIGPKISKKTSHLTLVAVAAAGVYLVLNIILIPRLGIQGAAITVAICYGILAFGSYFMGQRSYPIPLDWNRLLKLTIAASGSYLLISIVNGVELSIWPYYLVKVGACILFPTIALLLGVITRGQLLSVWRSLSEILQQRVNSKKAAALDTKF